MKNYKLSDFAKEQHNLAVIAGRSAAASAVTSAIGTMALSAFLGAGAVLITRPSTDIKQEKTKMRLASLEKGGVRTLKAEAIENRLNNARNEKQKTKFQEQLNEQLERDKRRYG